MAYVELYYCSIGSGLQSGDIWCIGIGGIVKEGVEELLVPEGIRIGGGWGVLIKALRGTKGNLERVKILGVHHGVWKRANVKRSFLEKRRLALFSHRKAKWTI